MQNKIGKLFIVATPIGNLADITLRALDILKNVDLILCEDTRVTKILLRHYLIEKPLLVYNDHSDLNLRHKIIEKLKAGQNLALVSDAGTPLISDPGYKLIQAIKENDIAVHPIPGACSIIAALTMSAIPTDRFMFIGFLPHKNAGKEKIFLELQSVKTSLVCFDSANRLIESLELIAKYFPARKIAVAREITKLYEESVNGNPADLIQYYQDNPDKLRGEIVILIAPPEEEAINPEEAIIQQLQQLMEDNSLRDAVEAVSSQYSIPKKQIYKLALQIK